MGRIKEISRKQRKRRRNPVVYLICEGSETEVRYFKRFRSRGCHIDIIPIPSQYKSAAKLVEKARATMGTNPYYPEEGDVIWCVFDRDDNTDEMLAKAKRIAEKEGYFLAYSNPAFEIWYLFHFTDLQNPIEDCQTAIRQLKQPKRLPDYEKNKDVYDTILPSQNKALKYAGNRLNRLRADHREIMCRDSNPVTTVSELVEYLNSKREQKSREG